MIELAEYEKLVVALTRADAEAIRQAAGNRVAVGLSAKEGHYELTATQHVGAIVTGNVSVAIRPKVPLHNLFLLLGVSPPDFDETLFGFGHDADLLSVMAAVSNIQPVYVRAARNFGITGMALFRRVILPATLPQIITSLRISLGIAWLVVVAAEMIAVRSGLGFLIIDARNAGKRYDLVIAGMAMIGVIGLLLDLMLRRLERFDEVRWGYSNR